MTLRDFSLSAEESEPKGFTVGADTFEGPPVIAPILWGDLMEAARNLEGFRMGSPEEVKAALERVAKFTDILLTPDSAPRFRERLFSTTEPLDLVKQVIPILQWLMEVYALRPTEASNDSTTGSSDAGGISTDTAHTEESTLGDFPLPGSSTSST